MRNYKFRGKRTDNGEWVYGYLVIDESGQNYIVNNYGTSYSWDRVDPETVGQYTGLSGIYEGDIGIAKNHGKQAITYKDGMFKFGTMSLCTFTNGGIEFRCEIIGNVYDNPELLEVKV